MPKPAGSGRKAGTPNKSTQELHAKCEALGLDPFSALCLIARDGDKEESRLSALVQICKYLYPQRKAVEIANDAESEGFRVVIEDYLTKKGE